MTRAPHPTNLEAFKRKAKEIKKATGCKHADALYEVARLYGFAHYHEAQRFYARLEVDTPNQQPL